MIAVVRIDMASVSSVLTVFEGSEPALAYLQAPTRLETTRGGSNGAGGCQTWHAFDARQHCGTEKFVAPAIDLFGFILVAVCCLWVERAASHAKVRSRLTQFIGCQCLAGPSSLLLAGHFQSYRSIPGDRHCAGHCCQVTLG